MILKLCIIFGMIAYALLEGWRDAYFYHYRNTSSAPKNENLHPLYTVERVLITLAVFFALPGWFYTSFICVGFVFVFPFFHDGMYFWMRNRLDKNVYPDKWFACSYTSSAVFEMKFFERVIALVLAVILFLAALFPINL